MAINIKQLLKLADKLDSEGKHKEADQLDAMIKKIAIDITHLSPEKLQQLRELGILEDPVDVIQDEDIIGLPDDEPSAWQQLTPEQQREIAEKQEWYKDPIGYVNKKEPYRPESESKLINTKEESDKMLADLQKDLNQIVDSGVSWNALMDVLKTTLGPIILTREEESGKFKTPKESHDQSIINRGILMKLSDLANDLDNLGATKEADLIDGFIKKYAGPNNEDLPIEDLISLADKLDFDGNIVHANIIDEMIKRNAEPLEYIGESNDTEQSKRYDSKHHHSLQIREPKNRKERVDREGREQHHVDTMRTSAQGTLSTRYCPDHVGVTLGRVGESTYQCPLDGQVYNWETGWVDYDGNENPGGSVAAQTPDSSGVAIPHRIFDSRENILNSIN